MIEATSATLSDPGVTVSQVADTRRVADLRRRVREAMEAPPVAWECPAALDSAAMEGPVAVRKARAIGLKLAHMPTDLWDGQLFAGSMTLEAPRVHAERGFPDYLSAEEHADAAARGLGTGCFGHIVPDYPSLLSNGLMSIRARAAAAIERPERDSARATGEVGADFLRSVLIAIDGVLSYAERLAVRCEYEAARCDGDASCEEEGTGHEALTAGAEPSARTDRRAELLRMASDLRVVPAFPARTFRQALQSVWLLHMVFHSTGNGNAVGRLDQYAWPLLERDLEDGRLTLDEAAELVDCFMLKFNERAKTTEDQAPERRPTVEPLDPKNRTRHATSSQIGTSRDRIDATNHWLQNIIVSGLTPDGCDGTNLVSHLLLRSFRRHQMTNPLITVRVHRGSPEPLLRHACEVLKEGGGMPAFFNDDTLIPAIEQLDIPTADARDYTNDGCWEVIIPGRTDFTFQRLSLMLCLERALSRNDPATFTSFEAVWDAFVAELDTMVRETVRQVIARKDDRNVYAPVPLLSALIDGAIESRTDMTAGGAKYRTFGMLAESAAHAIDSLVAIRMRVFEERRLGMADLRAALDADYDGYPRIRRLMESAPKYGNDDDRADSVGRDVIGLFTGLVERHAGSHREAMRFPCGVATFSWYIGIGEGLAASPDGRRSGDPVSSNFSPALGRDMDGVPSAIVSYGKMLHESLPAGGPLDLRIARRLIGGDDGTTRMAGLVRGFIETGGSMMTLTVADAEELKAAQRSPNLYKSLRVRMGGWCAYFTTLSKEQQDHQIHRQEGTS